MSSIRTCARGHQWEGDDAMAACPVCSGSTVVSRTVEPTPGISALISIQSTTTPPAGAAARVHGFTILQPHAQGGLGEVSLARDEALQRDVALKQIRPQFADDPAARQRFLSEAEVTGQLAHPGIVPVYTLGYDADGRLFYTMKFVHGRTLEDAVVDYHRQPPATAPAALRELLRRFISICHAVAYAHSRAVIHRDLKPSNIMLGEFGETLILDWGLAKRVGTTEGAPALNLNSASTSLAVTMEGQILGTPLYMSPEQAAGQLDRQGPASDVYALGAILYQILA